MFSFGPIQVLVVTIFIAIYLQRKYGLVAPSKDPNAKIKEHLIFKPGKHRK